MFPDHITDAATFGAQQFVASRFAAGRHNYTATNRADYVLNDAVMLFVTLGRENINFGGTDPLLISDAVWQMAPT